MIQSYPWYIADWRNSETRLRLTLAQRGLYRELLDYCYLEGSLPGDRKLILTIAGGNAEAEAGHTLSTAEALPEHSVRTARARLGHDLSTVLALFRHDPSTNRYHHPKVDEVLPKLLSYHEQKRHAGAKSGQARRERALNGRSDENRTDREPSPTPTPTPSKEEEHPLPPQKGDELLFDAETPAPGPSLVLPPASARKKRAKASMSAEQREWFAEYCSSHPNNTKQYASAENLWRDEVKEEPLARWLIETVKREQEQTDKPQFLGGLHTWLENHLNLQKNGVKANYARDGPPAGKTSGFVADVQRVIGERLARGEQPW